MNITQKLQHITAQAIQSLYRVEPETIEIQKTKDNFEGNYTIVLFPLIKSLKEKPEVIGEKIGQYLKAHYPEIIDFNIVKGFLNLTLSDSFLIQSFQKTDFFIPEKNQTVMVEYSSPNTNKPIHLGHIRNNLLGYSVSQILEAAGYKVIKSQIINDRGIHICKSMIAYQQTGNNETPEQAGIKGDKLVGKYYVAFDTIFKSQQSELPEGETPKILQEAQDMLKKWEEGDREVKKLWNTMNEWVYEGFNQTYKRLGVDFDVVQYESNTYLLGKDIVQEGLRKGVFFTKDDGSVWIDLTADGMDEKIVQRADGTAVYMTQDLGTAVERFKDYPLSQLIYTVGNEQDYHFKVLFLILKKLGYEWANQLEHLSYGMVDLPDGKMKSREGTVVDADDLMEDMYLEAKRKSEELGKLEGYSVEEKEKLYETIGLAALKYFILKVDPKKRILFNPQESIDFNGNTGPFIQYTYARIQSLLRKFKSELNPINIPIALNEDEKNIIIQLNDFTNVVEKAAETLSPSLIANYIYDLVKLYNSYYQKVPILNAETSDIINFRLQLSKKVGETIEKSCRLLGIEVPERM